MTKRRFVIEERKDPSGWWIVLAAAILIAFWKVFLVAIVVAGLIWLLLKQSERKRVNNALLSMHADHQNILAAYGDPVGTYGEYDAYTMPLTKPMYDMYDDGMRDWK